MSSAVNRILFTIAPYRGGRATQVMASTAVRHDARVPRCCSISVKHWSGPVAQAGLSGISAGWHGRRVLTPMLEYSTATAASRGRPGAREATCAVSSLGDPSEACNVGRCRTFCALLWGTLWTIRRIRCVRNTQIASGKLLVCFVDSLISCFCNDLIIDIY